VVCRGSTVVAIVGNKIAPGLGDWYLGQQGYGAQQYDGKRDPNQPNNIYTPVDEDVDHGAHGDFDDRARDYSVQVWADQGRDWILMAGAAGALCDACNHGLGKAWRGGLAGLALGTLATVGLAALAHHKNPRTLQEARTDASGAGRGDRPASGARPERMRAVGETRV
jgi:hypothetical protein